MPRELNTSIVNKMKLRDSMSGDSLELHYHLPTTEQRVRYQAQLFKVKGNKVKSQIMETRIKRGLELIDGFTESKKNDLNGEWEGGFFNNGKPISSDPDSPNYSESWKDTMAKGAADIISFFAMVVYEGIREDGGQADMAEDEDDDDAKESSAADKDVDPDPR